MYEKYKKQEKVLLSYVSVRTVNDHLPCKSTCPSRISECGGCFHSCWGWNCGDQNCRQGRVCYGLIKPGTKFCFREIHILLYPKRGKICTSCDMWHVPVIITIIFFNHLIESIWVIKNKSDLLLQFLARRCWVE